MPEKYLTRREAAEFIRQLGLPTSHNTLQKYATVGGGPVYRIFGNRAVYLPSELVTWVQTKLGSPRSSTSEVATSKQVKACAPSFPPSKE